MLDYACIVTTIFKLLLPRGSLKSQAIILIILSKKKIQFNKHLSPLFPIMILTCEYVSALILSKSYMAQTSIPRRRRRDGYK